MHAMQLPWSQHQVGHDTLEDHVDNTCRIAGCDRPAEDDEANCWCSSVYMQMTL